MVILGLVLLLAGVVIVLLGLFTSDVSSSNGTVEIANVDLTPAGVILAGMIAALLIFLGLWAIKLGAKQGLRRRREQKRLNELSEKLGRAEADRRRGDDEDETES